MRPIVQLHLLLPLALLSVWRQHHINKSNKRIIFFFVEDYSDDSGSESHDDEEFSESEED